MRPLQDVDIDDAPPPHPLRDIWREALRTPSLGNFLIAVATGLLLAAAGASAILTQSAVYYSQATLLIDNPPAIATAHDDSPILKLNVLRLKYSSLASTPAILDPAARASGLRLSDVQKAATFPTGAALVLVVAARTGSPTLSQRVANAVADEIPLYVQHEHDEYNIPAPDRFIITVVGHAYRGRKVAPSWSKAETAAIAAGLGGLALAYVVLQLISGTRRRL